MPTEVTTALTAGITSLKDVFVAAVVLAIPTGFAIWGIKVGIRVAPGLIRGFIHH